MEIGTVRQIDIEHEMQSAYLDYAMSVIVSRALPDVRDGLKPVHRRILYAMYDMGLRPDRPYKKSARIVGEVLGKYHPHGDAAVYEAMARMAQDFSLRYPLIDGQGNFGSIDGDSPAAMRYTEARMSPAALEMLADLDKDTVDSIPNFDDTLAEPSVLPAVVPNLLINGASGIAVGMTTSIPPHNLGEICDALVHMIDHYDEMEHVTVEDLTRFVLGPDFPTGGVVYRYAGEDGDGEPVDLIRNAYALGRGRLTVQAQIHIEDMSRGRSRLVVTELPYQVNKARLIERVAELVRDGKVEGITDLRDESDRRGMRLCIELTRAADPRSVLSDLFRLTPMQTTFGLRMLALADGEPRLMPLKRVLLHYLDHRQDVIARRCRYLLERARERAHILEGLLRALDRIEEVIAIIRSSQTVDRAASALIDALGLSETQALAILDMPLKRLTALERNRVSAEHEDKLGEIEGLLGLLASPARIRAVIREELIALKARYGDARRTRIVDREKGHHTARDLATDDDAFLMLWYDGSVSASPQVPRIPAGSFAAACVKANTHDDVAFFSTTGQAVSLPLHQLIGDHAVPVGSLAEIDRSAQLMAAIVLPHGSTAAGESDRFLAIISGSGRIKRVALSEFATAVGRSPVTAISLEAGDRLGWVIETSGQDDLLLVTRRGRAIRFSEQDVRPMGLAAAGVLAVKLGRDDAVVGGGLARAGDFVVVFTEKGHGKRVRIQEFPLQKRYGTGVRAARLSSVTGPAAVAVVAGEEDDIVLTTAEGGSSRLPVKAVPERGRDAAGKRQRADCQDPFFDPVVHGSPLSLVVLRGANAGTLTTGPGWSPEEERSIIGAKRNHEL